MHLSALRKNPPKEHFCFVFCFCPLGNPQSRPCVHLPRESTFLQRLSVLSSSMSPQLLSVLALLSSVFSACCSPVCHDRCCRFVEEFPGRVQRLREDYRRIRGFYESNDDLDMALLDQSVEDAFKSQFACEAMNSILEFYLSTVLPTAVASVTIDTSLKTHVESIQQIFDELKRDVHRCRKVFECKKPFDIRNLNSTYTEMESKGVFKAMGELDLLFNYIETYLASQRKRNSH